MKKNINEFIEESISEIKKDKDIILSDEVKSKMLNNILSNTEEDSKLKRLQKYICERPYRFAFSISLIQAVIFTIIFGSDYSNLLLNLFSK